MSVVDRRYDWSMHFLWASHFALHFINFTVYSFVCNHGVDCFIIFQCKFFTHFRWSNILTEYRFCSDMMFPSCRLGLSLLLAVIYFLVSVALSLPSDEFVEWCANPLYFSDKCIDQYKQTGGHKPKWKLYFLESFKNLLQWWQCKITFLCTLNKRGKFQ